MFIQSFFLVVVICAYDVINVLFSSSSSSSSSYYYYYYYYYYYVLHLLRCTNLHKFICSLHDFSQASDSTVIYSLFYVFCFVAIFEIEYPVISIFGGLLLVCYYYYYYYYIIIVIFYISTDILNPKIQLSFSVIYVPSNLYNYPFSPKLVCIPSLNVGFGFLDFSFRGIQLNSSLFKVYSSSLLS